MLEACHFTCNTSTLLLVLGPGLYHVAKLLPVADQLLLFFQFITSTSNLGVHDTQMK